LRHFLDFQFRSLLSVEIAQGNDIARELSVFRSRPTALNG
jgi:hypothetical protein